MQYVVSVKRDGLEDTLGPFNLETAEATVTNLAAAWMTREPFYAYVIPVPDGSAQLQHTPTGRDG